ncbi:hypothetical protein Tco_1477100 [Tanacetum coccineum]
MEKTSVDSNNTGGSGLSNDSGRTVHRACHGISCSYKTFHERQNLALSTGTEVVIVGMKRWFEKRWGRIAGLCLSLQMYGSRALELDFGRNDTSSHTKIRFHEISYVCVWSWLSTGKVKIEKFIRGFPRESNGV